MITRPLWVDEQGRQRSPQFWTNDAAGGLAVALAMTLKSYAGLSLVRYTTIENVGDTASTGPSFGVNDVADLAFTGPYRNQLISIVIPAPLDTLFLPDLETVDPVAASGIISAVMGNCTTPGGQALTGYAHGYRRRLTPPR